MTALLLTTILTLDAGESIRGQYIEARTCDVYTGSCFANADTGLTGKNAVMAWKIESGTLNGVKLDGLGVVLVLSATDTLGLKQSGKARAVVVLDQKATTGQRDALLVFVKAQTGRLALDVIAVRTADFDLQICACAGETCATLSAGPVTVKTKCLDATHDRGCGNEETLYPPLAQGVKAQAAKAVEHKFTGKELNETWSDAGRRGAFVGSFVTR